MMWGIVVSIVVYQIDWCEKVERGEPDLVREMMVNELIGLIA